jgi:hypothetical protein
MRVQHCNFTPTLNAKAARQKTSQNVGEWCGDFNFEHWKYLHPNWSRLWRIFSNTLDTGFVIGAGATNATPFDSGDQRIQRLSITNFPNLAINITWTLNLDLHTSSLTPERKIIKIDHRYLAEAFAIQHIAPPAWFSLLPSSTTTSGTYHINRMMQKSHP